MDRPPEPPWREHEERELLCNIIKLSPMSPRYVYGLIAQHRISPSWEDLPLPAGRSLNECRGRFDAYHREAPYPMQPAPSFSQPSFSGAPGSFGGPTRMRPPYEPSHSGGRPLLPKTAPSTPSEAGPVFPQSPLAEQQPAARKRGRPPKEEVVRRKAEAEARGEVYPAPRSKRAKRPPSQLQEAPSPSLASPYQSQTPAPPILSTPTGAAPAETGSESSGSKRRRLQRPADIETTGMGATRDPAAGSYESPPQSGFSQGQPGPSTRPRPLDVDTRMEGLEDPAPSTRTQSYREIVGIRGSTSG